MTSVTLQLLCLLAFYVILSESCRTDQCKLLPSTPDVSSEFHSLASENGVRIIYLFLKVGNSSYRPLDLKNVFFPERWVWANSISEPMLSMHYGYDIFSLSLLNNQARSIDVHLIEEPNGCLADLNSSCQSTVVGKALLENVTEKNWDKPLQRTDVVCVAVIGGKVGLEADFINGNIEYRCCKVDNGEKKAFQPPLHCDLSVQRSKWITAFDNVLLVAALIILLYCPVFPFALPEGIFMNIATEIKREKEAVDHDSREGGETTHGSDSTPQRQNENETSVRHQNDPPSVIPDEKDDKLAIPVDDTSPITCSVLLQKCATKLPGFQLSFNIKLVFLSYCVVPVFLYIIISLTVALKGSYLQEAFRKQTANLGGIAFYLLYYLRGYHIIFSLLFFLAPFVIAVSVKPKDLIEDVKTVYIEGPSITYQRTLGQRICMGLLILQDKVHHIFSSSSQSYLNGLDKFLDFTIRAFTKRTKYSVHASRKKRLLYVLCVLILSLVGFLFGVVIGGIFLTIVLLKTVFFVFCFSPSLNALGFLWLKLTNEMDRHKCPLDICAVIVTILVCADSLLAIILASVTVTSSCFLIAEVFGYTLMGLILNADIATPYAVFTLVAATNIYLCYANLQKRYMEAKGIISKEWHKNKGLLLQEPRHLANSNDDTIPKELFWFVCGEDLNAKYTILPIQTEMFHMFRNMICILGFLFLSLSAVTFFRDLYQLSTLASAIAVFVTGVIPKLFLRGFTKRKTLCGWEKIKVTRQIENAVKEYINDVNNGDRPRAMPDEFKLRNMEYTNMPQG